MATVFVSYRRDDAGPEAGRLYDGLVERFGRANVFRDQDSTPHGADFAEIIRARVVRCDALIAVIGPDWLGGGASGRRRTDDPSDWVRVEIATALARGVLVSPFHPGGRARHGCGVASPE